MIKTGSFSFTTSSSQAGAHADLTTSFAFVTDESGDAHGNLRNINTHQGTKIGVAGCPKKVKHTSSKKEKKK